MPWIASAAAVALLIPALVFAIGGPAAARPDYSHMAPVSRYLIADRNAEIAMARSAAPAEISRPATILTMGVWLTGDLQ